MQLQQAPSNFNFIISERSPVHEFSFRSRSALEDTIIKRADAIKAQVWLEKNVLRLLPRVECAIYYARQGNRRLAQSSLADNHNKVTCDTVEIALGNSDLGLTIMDRQIARFEEIAGGKTIHSMPREKIGEAAILLMEISNNLQLVVGADKHCSVGKYINFLYTNGMPILAGLAAAEIGDQNLADDCYARAMEMSADFDEKSHLDGSSILLFFAGMIAARNKNRYSAETIAKRVSASNPGMGTLIYHELGEKENLLDLNSCYERIESPSQKSLVASFMGDIKGALFHLKEATSKNNGEVFFGTIENVYARLGGDNSWQSKVEFSHAVTNSQGGFMQIVHDNGVLMIYPQDGHAHIVPESLPRAFSSLASACQDALKETEHVAGLDSGKIELLLSDAAGYRDLRLIRAIVLLYPEKAQELSALSGRLEIAT